MKKQHRAAGGIGHAGKIIFMCNAHREPGRYHAAAAIEKVDVDTLEPVMAGIVLGDGAPNIILGITADGELAGTGMNY